MDTVHECDRQTDGRTEGRTDRITITKTVQRIASHGKNELVGLLSSTERYEYLRLHMRLLESFFFNF